MASEEVPMQEFGRFSNVVISGLRPRFLGKCASTQRYPAGLVPDSSKPGMQIQYWSMSWLMCRRYRAESGGCCVVSAWPGRSRCSGRTFSEQVPSSPLWRFISHTGLSRHPGLLFSPTPGYFDALYHQSKARTQKACVRIETRLNIG